MSRYTDTDEFRGAEFHDLTMADAQFREVDLTGVRMYGVLLINADVDGAIDGLRVNGVEVAPLIAAELDRQYPIRTRLRGTTPAELRIAWSTVDELWAPTVRRAQGLSVADQNRSVNNEWSFVETLRHLLFVIDSWFGVSVLGRSDPFHRLGLPSPELAAGNTLGGLDLAAKPELAEVLAARAERAAEVAAFLADVTQEELDQPRDTPAGAAWPPPGARTPVRCLGVILNEEWAHHQFAVRDLDAMAAAG
jgi:hypothetical protein